MLLDRASHIRPKVGLWLLLLLLVSACRPKKSAIPETVEPIAYGCYEALLGPERTPQIEPSMPMEGGTFLILWTMTEAPDEYGSCTVDGSGRVLLLTSNAASQPASEPDSEPDSEPASEPDSEPDSPPQDQAPALPSE